VKLALWISTKDHAQELQSLANRLNAAWVPDPAIPSIAPV
jgi:hypothetical protein